MASSFGISRSRNLDFEECLRNRKIIFFPRAKKLVPKEMTAAREDLDEARDRLAHGKFKYATINSYYAIFHAARALLYSWGYRERSHSCLAVALEAIFVERGLLEMRFVRIFRESMVLRENADYTGTFLRPAAEQSLAHGETFISAARQLLRLPGSS